MSDITKKVDRNIPVNQRSVSFDESEASTGDVILVEESLGRCAQHLTFDSTGGMTVRLNVYQKTFPLREPSDNLTQWWPGLLNLAKEVLYKSETNALIEIGSSETFVLDDEVPVRDIELVTVSGNFTIIAM